MDLGSSVAKSCGVGHRYGLDLVLLWLWCKPSAVAPFRLLAWELPYAPAKKKKKKFFFFKKKRMCGPHWHNPIWKYSLSESSGSVRPCLIHTVPTAVEQRLAHRRCSRKCWIKERNALWCKYIIFTLQIKKWRPSEWMVRGETQICLTPAAVSSARCCIPND